MQRLKNLLANSDLALFIPIATAIAYALVYCHSLGFNSYYKLPSEFVDFNIKTLTGMILSIVLLTSLLSMSAFDLKGRIEKIRFYSLKGQMITYGSVLLLIIVFILVMIGSGSSFKQVLTGFLPFLTVFFSLITFYYPKNKQYNIVLAVLCSLSYFYLLGDQRAMNKDEYLILEQGENKHYVMINTFEQKFIIAPVDLKNKVIEPRFQLIEMKSEKDNQVELKFVYTGRLKVKEYAD